MDVYDAKILQNLSENGKVTQQELAERIGLSLSACQRRIKVLEENGAIQGYRAVIDPELLGEAFTVFVGINLERHSRAEIQAFQTAVIRLEGVKEVHHIAGQYDYLLKVKVADIQAYENFHADRLAGIKGIAQITSHITMSTFKS
ncbi:MAG: Lrp/AsnC family transcriptional regulator [Maricaulaceae bacterium]